MTNSPEPLARTVLELDGLQWASQAATVEATLRRRPGVLQVDANPSAQTATVVFDPARTGVVELAARIRECGYGCRGESLPDHICPPQGAVAVESAATAEGTATIEVGVASHGTHAAPGHAGHDTAAEASAAHVASPAQVMGHGGHGEASMADMVRDMRNRFVVAAVFGVVVTLWSRIGRDVLGFTVSAPFGLRDDVFQLLLSLPVMAYSAQVFFAGAVRALRARTLDMMVLVAVAVGA
ncbi:MAG: cation transporter, partial [Actinobacteria bacterium]|nr:cation transporter [Actinomycetota bacterium]